MHYTAIVPSRTQENLALSILGLRANSRYLDNTLVIWDGDGVLVTPFVKKPLGLDVYGMYNFGVESARTDWVLLINDDMYVPPGWDKGLDGELDPNAFYTVKLVESGWITVSEKNIERDFGKTIATFDREGFEAMAKISTHTLAPGLGWYMPVLINRETFLRLGGYPTSPPFPNANDVRFFENAKKTGIQFMQLDSMVYHFQCLSQR